MGSMTRVVAGLALAAVLAAGPAWAKANPEKAKAKRATQLEERAKGPGHGKAKAKAKALEMHANMTAPEMARALAQHERVHRMRLARIARLRELATEKGQTDRLARLDELETKENARYEKVQGVARRGLGKEKYAKAKAKIEEKAAKKKMGGRPGHADEDHGDDHDHGHDEEEDGA